jgi:hypothetical protein
MPIASSQTMKKRKVIRPSAPSEGEKAPVSLNDPTRPTTNAYPPTSRL